MGGFYGFMNGWIYLLDEMIIYPSFGLLGFASVVFLLSPTISSIPFVWIPLIIIPFATGLLFNYFGIKPSLVYLLITASVEVIFLLSTSWYIILTMGAANTISVFSLSGINVVPFIFALLYGIEAYGGLGTVIGISEETKVLVNEKSPHTGTAIIAKSPVYVHLALNLYFQTAQHAYRPEKRHAIFPQPLF